jgi:hypothetical protein
MEFACPLLYGRTKSQNNIAEDKSAAESASVGSKNRQKLVVPQVEMVYGAGH